MNEFDYIKNYILPLDKDNFIGDDAAIINSSNEFVVTKDILVEGVHFLENSDAKLLAKKALRVSLSDIAAMGATPYGYLLGLVLPKNIGKEWWRDFTNGLAEDNKQFNIKLLGGDTTANIDNHIIISITAIGLKSTSSKLSNSELLRNRLLRRSGAKVGDLIYISGTIGDAALGLIAYKGVIEDQNFHFKNKYDLPEPRVSLGQAIACVASSCIDISDGLIQDMEHICTSSSVGAEIYLESIPISDEANSILQIDYQYVDLILGGGDDYELLFTISPEKSIILKKIIAGIGVNVTKIGQVVKGDKVVVYDKNHNQFQLKLKGFKHFT